MIIVENCNFSKVNCEYFSVIWVTWKQSACCIIPLYSSTFYSLVLPFFVLVIFKFKYDKVFCQAFWFHFQIRIIWTGCWQGRQANRQLHIILHMLVLVYLLNNWNWTLLKEMLVRMKAMLIRMRPTFVKIFKIIHRWKRLL